MFEKWIEENLKELSAEGDPFHSASGDESGGPRYLLFSGFPPLCSKGESGGGAVSDYFREILGLPGGLHLNAIKDYDRSLYALETVPLPAAAESYDGVIIAGILEHLRLNPLFFLSQCHRILVAGGFLCVAVPHVLRGEVYREFLQGRNFYGPFSSIKRAGERTREFSDREMRELLGNAGFEVLRSVKPAGGETEKPRDEESQNIADMCRFFSGSRELDFSPLLMYICRKTLRPRYSLSSPMFRMMHMAGDVYRNFITIGENDDIQLSRGWYYREKGPPPSRWTQQSARFALRREDDEHVMGVHCHIPETAGAAQCPAVYVEDRQCEVQMNPGPGWQTLRVFLPPQLPEIINCSIVPGAVYQPSLHGLKDTRELGICVSRIFLKEGHYLAVGENDDVLLKQGWHEREFFLEQGKRQAFRWTGEEASFVLIPLGGENTLRLTYTFPHSQRVSASLEIGRLSFASELPHTEGWQHIQFTLPVTVFEPLELRLQLSGSWIPAEQSRDSSDFRKLGIALRRAELTKAG